MNITEQELGQWLSNNWRLTVTQEASKGNIRCTAIDVISREHAEDVKKECWDEKTSIQQRATAAKRVLENMTPAEREKIHEKVKQYKEVGLPSEIQRM